MDIPSSKQQLKTIIHIRHTLCHYTSNYVVPTGYGPSFFVVIILSSLLSTLGHHQVIGQPAVVSKLVSVKNDKDRPTATNYISINIGQQHINIGQQHTNIYRSTAHRYWLTICQYRSTSVNYHQSNLLLFVTLSQTNDLQHVSGHQWHPLLIYIYNNMCR